MAVKIIKILMKQSAAMISHPTDIEHVERYHMSHLPETTICFQKSRSLSLSLSLSVNR